MYQDTDHHWRERALCRTEDPELFHPVGVTGPAIKQVEEAKSICARCSQTIPCLAEALSIPGCTGVWAGTDENDRRAMVRRYRRHEQVSA